MNKITKILISATTAIIALGGFASVAFAIDAISTVQFEQTPLFNNLNFAPGNSVTRWVKLYNGTADPHKTIVRAIDVVNSGDYKLGDAVHLVIKEGVTIWYDGTFTDFFSKPEVLLEQIPAGTRRTYDFTVTFDSNSGNDYQNSTMSFSLQAGFEEPTGDEVITDTTTTISGQIGGGGGGGTTSGTRHLVITAENAVNQEPVGSGVVVVTWNTNIPATSQVIYGLTSSGPYNINMSTLPNFGYPSGTLEQDLGKVTTHSITISLLPPGNYVYRVVSRASPATISYEHEFTVPFPSQNGSVITSGPLGVSAGEGSVLGASTDSLSGGNATSSGNVLGDSSGVARASNGNNLASVVTSGLGGLFSWWWFWLLLVLLAAYLIWRFVLKPRNE